MSVAMEERSPLLNGSIGATNGTANGSAGPGLNSNASNGGCTGNGTLVHTATRTTTSQTALPFTCSGCGKPIVDKYLLKALDVYWHEDCLKCGCCDCRLGEVGSTLYTRANLILCKRDYLRLFGTSGNCAACCKVIPAFEMVMRAKNNVYHLDCFSCSSCQQRFCVGDRFYLMDNKILCEYDYEERLIFANIHSSAATATQIQRRVTDIQSGNGAIRPALESSSRGFGQSSMEAPVAPRRSTSESPASSAPSREGLTGPAPQPNQQQQQQKQQRLPLPHHQLQQQQQQQQLLLLHQQPAKKSAVAKARHSPSDGSSSGYGSPDSALLLSDDR